AEGEIVTNAHVVTEESGDDREAAEQVYVEFPDRNVVEAEIVGFDPFVDVGLLRIEPDGFDLQPLRLGDDRDLRVGQPVAAIGSPFGEQQSLSVGVVSATDRAVQSLTQFEIAGAIQTDASINPGNSGGPLLDAGARVIGINQQIETNSGANDGVGFAVPVSAIKRSVAQLQEDGNAEYAYIGVSSQALYPQLAEKLGLDTTFGGLIAEVVPGGPADDAGLEGGDKKLNFQAAEYRVGGDVILQIDGHDVVQPDDLARLVATKKPGEKVTLTVLHDGDKEQVQVTLGKRPDESSSG
ncbi:MAG: trypsin-like peptidase domain-containing protein, partial [Solirubrobacterales bacterium]